MKQFDVTDFYCAGGSFVGYAHDRVLHKLTVAELLKKFSAFEPHFS
jgi:hypothetical protein